MPDQPPKPPKSEVPDASTPDDADSVAHFPARQLGRKVRKVSGHIGELVTLGQGGVAGKKTDFRFAMDRDLDELAVILATGWSDDSAQRSTAAMSIKTIIRDLKRRATSSGYALLAKIIDLFTDYLDKAPVDRQDKAAIQNYLDAILVISKKDLIGSGGPLGEAMAADLARLNEQAGVPRA